MRLDPLDHHLLQVIICQEEKAGVAEPEPDSCGVRYILYPALLSLSCLGLLATIIVYSVLGEFHHLPGKILLCLCVTLLTAKFLLVFDQVEF